MSDTLVQPLMQLFADNFVVYYKSHGFHFNVEGPTFSQDHGLLNEIYDFLWASHDDLGEQIRQLDKPAPRSLKEILDLSDIKESVKARLDNKDMLVALSADFDDLREDAQLLYDAAGSCGCGGLETLVGDYLKALSKLHWKVKATIGKSFK